METADYPAPVGKWVFNNSSGFWGWNRWLFGIEWRLAHPESHVMIEFGPFRFHWLKFHGWK